MKDSDLAMFQQAFFEEATELLDDLEVQLLDLEARKEDVELLNTIFRCAHSIKGSSATFGFPAIAAFTHQLETLLDKVRSGSVPVNSELCAVMLLSLDQMRALLGQAKGERTKVRDDTDLLARIVNLASGIPYDPNETQLPSPPKPARPVDSVEYTLRFYPGRDVMRTGCDPCLLLAQLLELGTIESVERDDAGIPDLETLDPEACYVGWTIRLSSTATREEILEAFDFVIDESEVILGAYEPQVAEAAVESVSSAAVAVEKPKSEGSILRVSSEKVDRLVNLVGELVIAQSMLNEAVREVEVERHPRLEEAVLAIERTSRELQERVMGIRLVQLKHALGRFPRLVHDLSHSVGKKIDLITIGEETELDKTLIEALGDPLTHLVRNCVDHGLETAEERKAVGKPEVGTLKINARYEGGSVVIEVSDDGRGLSKDRILAKARENGLISDGDALSDEAIYNLIFSPGFSTAAKVTDLSGRGVGMDIVRQAIRSMNGTVTISTTAGKGTSFRIRLPLTLAILEGLSLSVGKETYIIPLTSIVESHRPAPVDLLKVAGRHEVVKVRGEVLRIVRLHEVFNIPDAITNPCEGLLVIVENEDTKVALLVDELITQNQAVIKSLEANYQKVKGVMGATILGDGKVALIIDVPGLLQDRNVEAGLCLAAA